MKWINTFGLIFALVVVFNNAQAQQVIKGVVTDAATQKPINMVLVSVDDTNFTYTNTEGVFQIKIDNSQAHLVFDNDDYEVKEIEADKLPNGNTIALTATNNKEGEVVITGKSTKDLLADIYKTSKGKLDKSLILHTFYREFIARNQEYTKFSDGMLDYYIKRSSGKSDLVVEQSRAFFVQEKDTNQRQEALNSINLFDVRKQVKDCVDFGDLKKYLINHSEKYDIVITEKKNSDGSLGRTVKYTPKPNQKDELITGQLTYDAQSNLITSYEFAMSDETKQHPDTLNFLGIHCSIQDFYKKGVFKIYNGKYVPMYHKEIIDIWLKFKKLANDRFATTAELTTLSFEEKEKAPEKDKIYNKNALYMAGTHYTTNYWESNNIIVPTQAEQAVINSLEAGK